MKLISFLLFSSTICFFLLSCVTVSKETNLFTQSRFSDVIQYYEQNSAQHFPNHRLRVITQSYLKLNDFDKFFQCLNKMEKQYSSGDTNGMPKWHPFKIDAIAQINCMKGEAFIDLGQYKKALHFFKESYKYWMKNKGIQKQKTNIVGDKLVICYALSGEVEKAKKILEEVKAGVIYDMNNYGSLVRKKMLSSYGLIVARMYMSVNEFDKVYQTLTIDIPFESGTDRRIDIFKMPCEFLLAKSLYETNRKEKAKEKYLQLLEREKIQGSRQIYWIILHDLGMIAYLNADSKKAIEYFKNAIEVIEEQRSTINKETQKIGFVRDKQSVYKDLVAVLFEEGRYTDAFEYVERGKARALVDMLASKERFGVDNTTDNSGQSTLLAELEEAEMQSLVLSNEITLDSISATRGLVVEAKNNILKANTELASLVTVSSTSLEEIQQLLPSGETLVEYYGGKDGTVLAFMVTRDDIQGVKLEAKDLDGEISRFRDGITLSPEEVRAIDVKTTTASSADQVKEYSKSLYDKLIKPIEDKIVTNNITIVPHGKLHYLPFAALCSDKGYLIDNYNIRVLPSASVMKFLKKEKVDHAGTLLAFGNPDLNDSSLDLPGAQEEVLAITKDTPDAKVLLRKQATETAVKRFGGQFENIHFATHGTFDAEKPLTSGLMLSGDSENDGTLTVGELYDLRLNSDMVTLSACETALGKVANGDDVVGFSRGFLYAGVSSIVSSLWKVDDKATSILMQEFYKSLKETDKRNALRTAQLKVKDTYNSHPYFWAAFQITGAVE